MRFEVHSKTERGITVLEPEGALDETTSVELVQAVSALMENGDDLIVIDLARTTAASSHAFRALLMLSKRLLSTGGRLVVCAAQNSVANALKLSGLTRLCCVRDHQTDAVDELLIEERIERLAALVSKLLVRGERRRKLAKA